VLGAQWLHALLENEVIKDDNIVMTDTQMTKQEQQEFAQWRDEHFVTPAKMTAWIAKQSSYTPQPFGIVEGLGSFMTDDESKTLMRADHLAWTTVGQKIEPYFELLRGVMWLGFGDRTSDLVGFIARPRLLSETPELLAAELCTQANEAMDGWGVKVIAVPAKWSKHDVVYIAAPLETSDWRHFMRAALAHAF
jgi:hypothetical protein